MADGKRMEKVDMSKEFSKLSDTHQFYIRKLEQMNRERATATQTLKRRNWFTGMAIGVGVLSIYLYSMYAVRQERFLGDFDNVPDKK